MGGSELAGFKKHFKTPSQQCINANSIGLHSHTDAEAKQQSKDSTDFLHCLIFINLSLYPTLSSTLKNDIVSVAWQITKAIHILNI